MKKEDIQIIGFDLDQTLYPKSPEIDDRIQETINIEISKKLNITIKQASTTFKTKYAQLGSGRRTLIQLGFTPEQAQTIVQNALDTADILDYLRPVPETIKLLQELHTKYKLDLITGSNKELTHKKLKHLQIPTTLFGTIITGETSKYDGTAYKQWMALYPELQPNNFLYIGDRKPTDSDMPASLGINTILVNVQKKEPEVKVPQLETVQELREILC